MANPLPAFGENKMTEEEAGEKKRTRSRKDRWPSCPVYHSIKAFEMAAQTQTREDEDEEKGCEKVWLNF